MLKYSFSILILLYALFISFARSDDQGYSATSRYDYYTHEKTGQIVVYTPGSKTGMTVTADIVFAFDFLNRNVPVFPGHAVPVSFSLEKFKPGDNEVTVSFYEDGKWIDSRKVNILLKAGKANEVKCDLLTGTLVADEMPFFPVGFYCQWPLIETFPEEEAVRGFNLMSPYWKIDKKNRKDRIKFMDRCAELGMKVNYNLCNVAAGGMMAEEKGSLSKSDQLKLLQQEVEAIRDHPALLSWYLFVLAKT